MEREERGNTTAVSAPEVNMTPDAQAKRPAQLRTYLFVKRVFDFTAALVALVLAGIPMLIIGACVWCSTKGPTLLKQERVGQYGRVFIIYKFRTMYYNAPHDVATTLLENADSYITPVGRFLRKTSLDELPQLINVLKGEMSLVGFRPVVLTEKKLNNLRQNYGVFECKPGITGLAQIRGRDDISYKEKARIDAEYAANRSIKLDLYCLFKTIPFAASQKGAK
jgi:lipopolysaccharide/colanic/teichoic acid biosynthesis glycosyltransferase